MDLLNSNDQILGRGWASPPTFIKGPNQALMNQGELNVNENLKNLLETRLLERPFKPKYGTKLKSHVFASQTNLPLGEIQASIAHSIDENEPRIKVQSIDIQVYNEYQCVLLINIAYTFIAVNSRHNFIYPFYITEGTHLDLTMP